jgi:DNA modification methylase
MTTNDSNNVSMEHKSNIARLSDSDIHDWYRMVFAYSDKLITDLVDEFDITEDDLLLDPFNGTGTTTLAAKKHGIDSIGTDASPIAVLAGRTKTNWDVDLDEFIRRRDELLSTVKPVFDYLGAEGNATLDAFTSGETADSDEVDLSQYDLEEPEKTPKDWLSEKPRKKMLVLRHHVDEMPEDEVTDLFRLAMCAILPEDVANIGFGPEAYKVKKQEDVDVYGLLVDKLDDIESDLRRVQEAVAAGEVEPGEAEVLYADAREIGEVLREESELLQSDKHNGEVDYVITSPPYPAEHDYTRNQRLELVWMGEMEDTNDLQRIKKANIRSNTKNIYVADSEGEELNIRENERIDDIVSEMETIIEEEDIQHGFGQYYPRVVEEYFAGMQRHFEQVYDLLAPGGKAAYVVADSGSYWQVDIKTGTILAELAEERVGFTDTEIELWRNLQATTGEKDQREEILILTKPE